jgi:Raf kinase inhibitor-like YbhB/YbcL family protein
VRALLAVTTLLLSSPAIHPGGAIPKRYTCDGRDVSPPLRWTAPPAGARSLALRVYDVDARFTHWIAWGISTRSRGLRMGQRPPKQGRNDFGRVGYGGPCPPAGERHRYVFVLYALAKPLVVPAGSSAGAFAAGLRAAHVLAQTTVTGTYARG